jgi:hypothetical protein
LRERLTAPAVRQAFDEAMGRLVDELLTREHGPLAGSLSPALSEAVAGFIAELGERTAERVAVFAETPDFVRLVERTLERLREDLGPRPLGGEFTSVLREAVAHRVGDWTGHLAEGDEVEATLRAWVEGQLAALEADPRPIADRLPPGLLAPLEQAIEEYLPTAMDQLAGLLADPDTRAAVSRALRVAFDGAARQLLLHERLLARLVVTDATFERLLDGLEAHGFERFAASLAAPELRRRLAQVVHQALQGLLRMPLGERLARLSPDRRAALCRTVGDWVVDAARSPATRDAVQHLVGRGLDAVAERTWGELLALFPVERLADVLRSALQSEAGRVWVAGAIRGAAERLLAQPIGRPADWLGPQTLANLTRAVADTTWTFVQEQVPEVVERIRVPEMVEQKVLSFPTQRLEEIVRGVTQRELDLIVRLGYVIGGLVGLIAFAVSQVV